MLIDKCVTVSVNDTCDFVYRLISAKSNSVNYPGVAIVVYDNNSLAGVVTDGDFRRGYNRNDDFSQKFPKS